jgi:hypothetical protein
MHFCSSPYQHYPGPFMEIWDTFGPFHHCAFPPRSMQMGHRYHLDGHWGSVSSASRAVRSIRCCSSHTHRPDRRLARRISPCATSIRDRSSFATVQLCNTSDEWEGGICAASEHITTIKCADCRCFEPEPRSRAEEQGFSIWDDSNLIPNSISCLHDQFSVLPSFHCQITPTRGTGDGRSWTPPRTITRAVREEIHSGWASMA